MTVNGTTGYYIDDDAQGAAALARRLEGNSLSLKVVAPVELMEMTEQILHEQPDLLILDYRLDQNKGENGLAASYRAGPVAQHFRDKAGQMPDRDFPIVILSSEDKLRDYYDPEKTAHDLFDWRLLKGNVSRDGAPERQILAGLIEGYSVLRKLHKDFSASGTEIFGVAQDDSYLIDYQELDDVLEDSQSPHILARYIIKHVIRRNGVLANWEWTRSKLGLYEVDLDSKRALHEWLNSLEGSYTGVFYGCQERWWVAKLDRSLEDFFGSALAQLTARERVDRLNSALGLHMTPAENRWDGSADYTPTFPCASCKRPTPVKNSLACLDIGLPSFVLRRRVCWTCVQTDEYLEKKLRIDAKDLNVANRLRANQIQPEQR